MTAKTWFSLYSISFGEVIIEKRDFELKVKLERNEKKSPNQFDLN